MPFVVGTVVGAWTRGRKLVPFGDTCQCAMFCCFANRCLEGSMARSCLETRGRAGEVVVIALATLSIFLFCRSLFPFSPFEIVLIFIIAFYSIFMGMANYDWYCLPIFTDRAHYEIGR